MMHYGTSSEVGGVTNREDLTTWFREHGYPGAQPGNHITTRAQEHLLQRASDVDARVSLVESVFVIIAVQLGRQAFRPDPIDGAPNSSHVRPGGLNHNVPRPGVLEFEFVPVGSVQLGRGILDQGAHVAKLPSPSSWQIAGLSGFGVAREVARGNCLG